MVQSQTMVSAQEIAVLVGGILKVLRENIKDRKLLSAVGAGINQLLPDPEPIEAKLISSS